MPKERITQKVRTRADLPEPISSRWWNVDQKLVADSVFAVVADIESRNESRKTENQFLYALYENGAAQKQVKSHAQLPLTLSRGGRLSLNVIRACVNTAVAKIGKNRPRVTFLTDDGDWDLQDKAKDLQRFMDGLFVTSKVYEEAPKAFKDACIFDGGAIRIYVDDYSEKEPHIKAERAHVDEIVIDEQEAVYGKPKQLHQRRAIAKDVLAHLFPKYRDEIFKAGTVRQNNVTDTDMVWLIESWHLPSTYKSKDGKHTICIEGAVLHSEEWKKNYFPFVFYRWEEPAEGFWGSGIASELVPLQSEIKRLMKKIQVSIQRNAGGNWTVPKTCKIPKEHFTSESGGIIEYENTGGEPRLYPGIALPGDVYGHLERCVKYAFELTGISQSSSAGKKPAGVEAAVAIREVNDIESERFAMQALRYERMFLEIASIMIDMARDLYADGHNLSVMSDSGKFIRSIKWSDVNMDDDVYQMQMYPTSLLPTQPSAKLQKATELVQAGFLEKEEAMQLLDFPDVAAVTSLRTAALEDARMVVCHMLKGGDYIEPEPYDDLEVCATVARSEYLRGKTRNAKEAGLDNLRRYMDRIAEMLAPPPEPPPVPGLPPGPGGPPPVPEEGMMPPEGPPPGDVPGLEEMSPMAAGHAPGVSDILPQAGVGRRYLSPETNP